MCYNCSNIGAKRGDINFSRSRVHSEEDLLLTMDNIIRLIHRLMA